MLRRLSSGGPVVGGGPGTAVKALRGEEVLAWTQGHERGDAADGVGRRWLLRRGPTPGVAALLVCTCLRRGGALRIHLLAETGSSARTWSLADLRLVDGLGDSVRIATDFALTFAGAPRPLFWRCELAVQRARFLWSLLQVCAARLPGRAPPSQRLSLLELETFAKEGKEEDAAAPEDDAAVPAGAAAARAEARQPPAVESPPESHVHRTASEPQAMHRLVRKGSGADMLDPSLVEPSMARPPGESERELNVQQRAFVLAARRIGAQPPHFKRSRPASPPLPGSPPPIPSLCDAMAREGGSATELLVKRCKAQEERRHYCLQGENKTNLEQALQWYDDEKADVGLDKLSGWLAVATESAERSCISAMATIELDSHKQPVSDCRQLLGDGVESADWLLSAEASLASDAALIREVAARSDMLERHLAHAKQLEKAIEELLASDILPQPS